MAKAQNKPQFNYCSETRHFCSKSASAKLEKENERALKPKNPKSTKRLLDFRNTRYELRGTDILKLPKVNTTTYGPKSWRYLAPKRWNLLSESDRTVQTFIAFKNSNKKIDLAGLLS